MPRPLPLISAPCGRPAVFVRARGRRHVFHGVADVDVIAAMMISSSRRATSSGLPDYYLYFSPLYFMLAFGLDGGDCTADLTSRRRRFPLARSIAAQPPVATTAAAPLD